MIRLRFAAYSGIAYVVAEDDDAATIRAAAASMIRRRRRTGHPVDVLAKGHDYEIGEPEGCALVPDTAGFLWLEYTEG